MKKTTVRILSVILFLTIVTFSIVQLSYLYRGEFSHTRPHVAGFYAEENDTIDVVLSGGSYMFCSFMPMEAWHDYGMTSYNFSINMLFADSYKYYIREALKTQTPKLYVIDCGAFTSGLKSSRYANVDDEDQSTQIRRNTDALNYSVNRFELINEIMPKEAKKSSYYFDLLYYHDSKVPSFKYAGNRLHSAEKGYSALPLFSDEVYVDSDIVEVSEKEIPLEDEMNAIFLDLINELKKYDMEVLFLSQPNVLVKDSDYEKQGNIEYMKRVVEENGFDFLDMRDYQDEIGLNPTFDLALGAGDHFTCFGAEKITCFLGKYINEHYKLPDHRGDPQYSSWDDDYEQWVTILDGEKKYNSEFMMEVFSEDCNKEKMPEIMKNAEEYFVFDGNRIVDKYTGTELERKADVAM